MIQRVQQGDNITAAKTNELVNAANRLIKVRGGTTYEAPDSTLINGGVQFDRNKGGQKYREPFDLSCKYEDNTKKLVLCRKHLYLDGQLKEITSDVTIPLPQQQNISVFLTADQSEAANTFGTTWEAAGGTPPQNQKRWLLYEILSSGVVKEDFRSVSFGGGGDGGGISLDLSSLNWVQVSSEGEGGETVWQNSTSAQLWDYAHLRNGDVADSSELTANNGWLFPVRPPNGTPHLKYVELSVMQNVIGGGGGGCQCDLSVTPASDLSSLGQDLVQIADWTKDNWQTHVPILAPDVAKDVVRLYQLMSITPFWYNEATQRIVNNYGYCGREFFQLADHAVLQAGVYYLKIENNLYGTSNSYTIVRSDTTPNQMANTDSITYYPLWTITLQNNVLKAAFDWRGAPKIPQYSS